MWHFPGATQSSPVQENAVVSLFVQFIVADRRAPTPLNFCLSQTSQRRMWSIQEWISPGVTPAQPSWVNHCVASQMICATEKLEAAELITELAVWRLWRQIYWLKVGQVWSLWLTAFQRNVLRCILRDCFKRFLTFSPTSKTLYLFCVQPWVENRRW